MNKIEFLRKYVACFGLLECPEDSTCPFVKECRDECFRNVRRAIREFFRRRRK